MEAAPYASPALDNRVMMNDLKSKCCTFAVELVDSVVLYKILVALLVFKGLSSSSIERKYMKPEGTWPPQFASRVAIICYDFYKSATAAWPGTYLWWKSVE